MKDHILRDEDGYTLLEVLVAFTILVISLGALYQVVATGATSTVRADQYMQALMLAESKLESLGIEKPLTIERTDGTFDDTDIRWEFDITPFETGETPDTVIRKTHQMFEVDLTVTWQDGRHTRDLELTTLRMVPVE